MDYFDRYYRKGVNDLGFGPDRGLPWGFDPFPGHGLRDVIANALLNTAAINVELFGWCIGGVAAVVLGAVLQRRAERTWLWLSAIAAIAGVHSFYWFSGGPDFGARYWFLLIVPCVALAATGLNALDTRGTPPRAALAALLLSAAAMATFVPWRAADKYFHYRGMRSDIRAMARDARFDGALVLIRGRRFPDYASAAVYNPVDLRGPGTVFAWDRDPETGRSLLAAYPDRPVWVVAGPSVTGGGYTVVAGPVTGADREHLSEEP